MVGASPEGLRMTVLPQTMAAEVMPAMMARGKFHGGNDGADAEGDVAELVALAGELDGGGGRVEAEGFAGVELEEVDGLAHVGVGLGPVLADLIGEPRAQLELAQAHEAGGAEEQGSAFGRGLARPGCEGGLRGGHRGFHMLLVGALVDADDFGGARRVDGDDLGAGADALATDDEVIIVAEPGLDAGESFLHGTLDLRVVEVEERLVDEGSVG